MENLFPTMHPVPVNHACQPRCDSACGFTLPSPLNTIAHSPKNKTDGLHNVHGYPVSVWLPKRARVSTKVIDTCFDSEKGSPAKAF